MTSPHRTVKPAHGGPWVPTGTRKATGFEGIEGVGRFAPPPRYEPKNDVPDDVERDPATGAPIGMPVLPEHYRPNEKLQGDDLFLHERAYRQRLIEKGYTDDQASSIISGHPYDPEVWPDR